MYYICFDDTRKLKTWTKNLKNFSISGRLGLCKGERGHIPLRSIKKTLNGSWSSCKSIDSKSLFTCSWSQPQESAACCLSSLILSLELCRSVERLSVTERYYTPLYYVSPAADDFCVLLHSNRICVVTLASSHALLVGRKIVQRVDCQVSSTLNRLDNTVCLFSLKPICTTIGPLITGLLGTKLRLENDSAG